MIKKILDKQSERKVNQLDEAGIISDIKLLIDSENMEDLRIMQDAFPSSNNVSILRENANRVKIKDLQQKHNGDIFTTEEIKLLCMKYRLRFLPANLYKGIVPSDFLTELRRKFTAKNGLAHLTNAGVKDYSYNLFMVAPANMFDIKSYSQKKKDQLREAKRLKRQDPAVFVKIEDDKFLFLREWGNSFSPFRRFLGAITSRSSTLNLLFLIGWVAYTSIIIFLIIFLFGNSFYSSHGGQQLYVSNWFTAILSILTLVWGGISTVSWLVSDGFFMAYFKDQDKGWWNTDKDLATENNWNKR